MNIQGKSTTGRENSMRKGREVEHECVIQEQQRANGIGCDEKAVPTPHPPGSEGDTGITMTAKSRRAIYCYGEKQVGPEVGKEIKNRTDMFRHLQISPTGESEWAWAEQAETGGLMAGEVQARLQRSCLATAASPLKVCIVGSGNWGSAVAKIIGNNVKKLEKFASVVKMWVFEETVNGRKLTDIINNDHENVKYLPGHKLPENAFIHGICDEISGKVPKGALGISLIKGIDEGPEGLKLISDIIREKVGIDISVLMGANAANEVAAGKFCETTIGCKVMENGLLFKELLQTPNFRITVVDDADTVELCGALKNIVAVGAGFCDGLRCGDNTKAAVIRLGLMEMIAFTRIFCKGQVSTATFLESCGVADLITTCYGGRNRKVAEAFAGAGRTIEELEREMLNGQKLQGPQTSVEVYRILKQKELLDKFPLFTAVYQICYEGRPVQEMLPCLQSHPEHI
ncbi:glycerol-3-phosphate dehydrogenase 1-like protein [Balaenoptera musculus]|uniref:Glycerol-3-phosphate dehydrogenase [NAD(+)] n=1 Tax=Balaenoptera musculus TaxID=9771 RepID=A0A8B8YX42_BALMU|nr:glycerol-3-phosphate dehydrogenase 1-like protein [Balaenoptera musculus]